MTQAKPKIYLAGPDVFFSDVEDRFQRLETLCQERGMQGLRPSDDGVFAPENAGMSPAVMAQRIYESNVEHIRHCDAVLANMMPFRGDIEPDSGTVFEVGMAIALGKPVALYLPQGLEDSGSRIRRLCGDDGSGKDLKEGALIEDFKLPLNLMLACSSRFFERPDQALDHLAEALDSQLRAKRAISACKDSSVFARP